MLLNNRKQNSQNFVLIFQSTIDHKEELSIGKRVKLRGMLSEGEGMDYMHLDNYGEITICEENEATENNLRI